MVFMNDDDDEMLKEGALKAIALMGPMHAWPKQSLTWNNRA